MSPADRIPLGDDVTPVDVTAWAVIRDEPGGRDRDKRWLAHDADAPRHEHWLWKARQTTGDGSERALTDCAEVFSSRLAHWLGLPAATCRFAVNDGQWGVISLNVTPPGFSLHNARTYLPEIQGYERLPSQPGADRPLGLMRQEQGYTLDAVLQVLEGVKPPPGINNVSAANVLAGYLVLDALIGNTDRHAGNWALLEADEDGQRYLAPTYDHGSALGAGLTETNRRTRSPAAFASKGRANPFSPNPPLLLDLARDAVDRTGAASWLHRLAALDRVTLRSSFRAPAGRLSDVAATFIEDVVMENRRRLCGDDSGED